LPIEGEPADVVSRIEAYDNSLANSEHVPKRLLTLDGSEDLMIETEMTAWCAANIAGPEIENCGPAAHVAPEDQPHAIASALVGWAARHDLAGPTPGQRA
jgi:haloalkane dehalogenase